MPCSRLLHRACPVVALLAACGDAGGPSAMSTGESSGAATATSAQETGSAATSAIDDTSTAADPADSSTSAATPTSESSDSDGSSSSESGDPPDCFADVGCSCVLGLCNSDLIVEPVACVDEVCVAATCGNDVIDPGEECDDGNGIPSDACTDACVPASCGDGILRIPDEWCDGADGSPCDAECDAQPQQHSGTDVAATCRLAIGAGARVHLGLGDPTNRVTTWDAQGEQLWSVDIGGGAVRAIGARADGEVSVGVTSSPISPTSTLQRFTADGDALPDAALAVEQIAARLMDIATLGDDTWVLASDSGNFPPSISHVLCRYDASWDVQWCAVLVLDGSVFEFPSTIALSSTGDAVLAAPQTQDEDGIHGDLWFVGAGGDIGGMLEPQLPPNAHHHLAGGVALSPDDEHIAAGWGQSSGLGNGFAVEWGVYDRSGETERFGEIPIRDAPYPSVVAYTTDGDLLVGNVIDAGNQYPWLHIETADGVDRYTQRGTGVGGLQGRACDLAVTADAAYLAGTTTLPERWFVTRFDLE